MMTLHAAALRSVLASCKHAIPTSHGTCEFARTRLLPVLGKTLGPCAESRLRAPYCDTLPQNAPMADAPLPLRNALLPGLRGLGLAQDFSVFCEQILQRLAEKCGLRDARPGGQLLHRRPHFRRDVDAKLHVLFSMGHVRQYTMVMVNTRTLWPRSDFRRPRISEGCQVCARQLKNDERTDADHP